jgi:glycosyltransferase involved in cell wall biosynthesis
MINPKVSMVITCYNNLPYIYYLFDSILAQKHDNIELILVNDGSTDGTREAVWEYSPKFRERGFEVVIVDQDNGGLCSAVKAGLMRITGDYVCCIDGDDELDPEYCSAAVLIMEDDISIDFTVCGHAEVVKEVGRFYETCYDDPVDTPWKSLISFKLPHMVWSYMMRRSYFDKTIDIKNFYTDTFSNHEPGLIVPLHFGGGKSKMIKRPLYHLIIRGESHSNIADPHKRRKFYDEYFRLSVIAFDRLDIPKAERTKVLAEFEAFQFNLLYPRFRNLDTTHPDRVYFLDRTLDSLKRATGVLITRDFADENIDIFTKVVFSILGDDTKEINPMGKIIGYGVLGTRAKRLLPAIKLSGINIDEYWDMAANFEIINGKTVTKPNIDTLNADDYVIVFPLKSEDIIENLSFTGCNVVGVNDLANFIAQSLKQSNRT